MLVIPQCATCVHFHKDDFVNSTCGAFPDGIPTSILDNDRDHRKPFRGDNGIRYERDPKAPEELVVDF